MSYDNPLTITHTYGGVDFGTGGAIGSSLQGPAGKQGRVVDVIATASEIFTTGGDILLGVAATGADYVNFPLGTLAATDTLCASNTSGAIVDEALPADTQIEITWNPTGGTPTGIADVQIVIEWY